MKIRLIFCLFLLFGTTTLHAQQKEFNISGIVLDTATKEPLMGVYVTTGKEGAQTNKKGFFQLKNIPRGEVTLSTMYYSSYPTCSKQLNLQQDTTLTFSITEELLQMNELVVTGTRTEKRLSESPVLTNVIRESEIQKAAAVSTLESLQDNIPGIVVSPNAMGNNMRIKGLNSRYILFLVDGERMVSEGAGGNINFDQIDVNNIKRIEMINGASSALYGSNAVGAVVNIITKKAIHKFEAGANVIAESNNTWKTKIEVGSRLKKLSTRFSAFRNSSDGFGENGGAYAARYSDYGGNFNLGYTPLDRVDINLVGRYFRHEVFNPAGSMNAAHPLTQSLAVGVNGGYQSEDQRNTMRLSLNYDKFFDYNVLEKKNNETSTNNTANYISSRFVNTFIPTERWEIVGGMEYNHQENYSTKTLGVNATTKTIDDANLFAQAQFEILKNLDLVAGTRYTYNSQFKSAFTPKVSLMYSVGAFKFRGGVGSAFRAPDIKELYYDFDHQGMFWIYGNPDLKAEKGVYSSLSTEYTKGGFNMSVSGYYNSINNKITQYDVINSAGANEKYYKNVSSATLTGVDVNLSYILFREIVLKGNYSYCDAKDDATGLQLSSNVKHSGTVSTTWNGKVAQSPFSLQLSGRINSPILYQKVVTDDSGKESTEITSSKAYSIWKAVLVKPIRLKKHSLELTLKVDNIFNFKESSFINPGRQYLAGVRYSFK